MAAATNRDEEAFWRLQRWRTVVDEAIAEARERGEFDDLPGHGKPLDLRGNRLAGDREFAFHVLANAGVVPPWMALDQEVAAARAALDASLARLRAESAARRRADGEGPPAWDEIAAFPVAWMPRLRFPRWPGATPRRDGRPAPRPTRSVPSAAHLRARAHARARYLGLAAALDAAIVRHNEALTDELRFLEKPRHSPERAGRDFDAAWPAP